MSVNATLWVLWGLCLRLVLRKQALKRLIASKIGVSDRFRWRITEDKHRDNV